MRNYGFDYLVEKVQVLNEMARFSEFWRTNFPDFENFYLQVQNKMKKHPKAPSGTTLGHKRIEYISRMLFDLLSTEELADIGIDKTKGFDKNVYNAAIKELSPEERIGSSKIRDYTPEYAKFAPKWADASFKQQEFMLSLMVRAYGEKALSSEKFVNKVMDEANIDAYFNKNLFKGGSSSFAAGMINKKEKMLKMGMGEVYEIQNKAKSIINKLRSSKKLPKGLVTSIYHANSENIGGEQEKELKQDDTAPLQAFIDALELFLDWKNRVKGIVDTIENRKQQRKPIAYEDREMYEDLTPFEKNVLSKYEITEITKLMQLFTQRLESNQPVKIEKIYNIIDKLGHEKIREFVRNEFDKLLSDYGEIIFSADEDRYVTIYDALDDNLLKGLIDEGIITDEESRLLAKWRKISSSLQQSIVSKSSRDDEKADEAQSREDRRMIRQGEYEKQGKKWEADKKSKEKGVKKPKIDITDEVAGLSVSQVEEKLREMKDDDVNPDDEYYAKIDAISKYLNKLKKDSPEDEEGVMGYMTEQVNKDRHLNNIGEYRDRGFKKPINHAHWLWLNQ
jgi:hypothetical protein